MTTTITIEDRAINATYQNESGTTTSIAGTGAKFIVEKTDGVYSVELSPLFMGTGYVAGDTITILGSHLGGVDSINDLILTVATVGTGGKIATFGSVGTGRVGDGVIDVQIDVTGSTGIDTYTFNDESTVYNITKNDDDITVDSALTSAQFKLIDHERIVFTDKAIAYDTDGRAGDVYALLAAALGVGDVTTDYEGIGIDLADKGWTNKQLAEALLATDTYKLDAGGVSDETFIRHVFENVMGTQATLSDVTELTTWMSVNHYSQADVLVIASQLEDFRTDIDLVGLTTTGIEYTPVV